MDKWAKWIGAGIVTLALNAVAGGFGAYVTLSVVETKVSHLTGEITRVDGDISRVEARVDRLDERLWEQAHGRGPGG